MRVKHNENINDSRSSRAKADLFELLVTINLSYYYEINPYAEYLQEIDRLTLKIQQQTNGKVRIAEQHQRSEILLPKLIEIINNDIAAKHGKPISIDWVGRKWQSTNGLEDLTLKFNDFKLGISLKSTRAGNGTQKNFGCRKLEELIGLNMDYDIEQMWRSIRHELKGYGGTYEVISDLNKSQIKRNKYKYPLVAEIGKKYGAEVQKMAAEMSTKLFNQLSNESKNRFLEEVYGLDTNLPLINAIVTLNTTKIYWNHKQNKNFGKLTAETDADGLSYKIYSDHKAILRVQCSFTNGIGLSPFCERVFMIQS